jgi:hypothetical protein
LATSCEAPQVLADLRRHLGRQRDRKVLVALGDRRADRALVRRIGVGVQEADGEAVDALLDQLGDLGQRAVEVDRLLDRPSAASRSAASRRHGRGTSGLGISMNRSYSSYLRSRPISSTSRKPAW